MHVHSRYWTSAWAKFSCNNVVHIPLTITSFHRRGCRIVRCCPPENAHCVMQLTKHVSSKQEKLIQCWFNAGFRRKQWANGKTKLSQRLVFVGIMGKHNCNWWTKDGIVKFLVAISKRAILSEPYSGLFLCEEVPGQIGWPLWRGNPCVTTLTPPNTRP